MTLGSPGLRQRLRRRQREPAVRRSCSASPSSAKSILCGWMLLGPRHAARPAADAQAHRHHAAVRAADLRHGVPQRHPPGPPPLRPAGVRADLLNVCHIVVVFIGARLLGLHADDTRRRPRGGRCRRRSPTGWRSSSSSPACCRWLILLPALRASRLSLQARRCISGRRWSARCSSSRVPGRAGGRRAAAFGAAGQGHLHRPDAGRRRARASVVDHFNFFGHLVRYPMEIGRPGPAQPRPVPLPVPAGRLRHRPGDRDLPRPQQRCPGQGPRPLPPRPARRDRGHALGRHPRQPRPDPRPRARPSTCCSSTARSPPTTPT